MSTLHADGRPDDSPKRLEFCKCLTPGCKGWVKIGDYRRVEPAKGRPIHGNHGLCVRCGCTQFVAKRRKRWLCNKTHIDGKCLQGYCNHTFTKV